MKAGGDAGEIGEVDGEFETRRRTTNMTSETNSTGFTDGGSLTSSMNIQPPEQMPKEILEEKQNRLKQRLESIRMIREEEALAMDIAMQQDSDNSNPSS